MSDAIRMLLSTSVPEGLDTAVLAEAIDATSSAAQAASACADACLHEYDIHRDCVSACLDTADVAGATVRVLSRTATWNGPLVADMVEACAVSTAASARTCEEHAAHARHCGVCAEACRRAERACQQLLAALASLAT